MSDSREPNHLFQSLFEIVVGFVGVLLILPALFSVLKGLFRLSFIRKLTGEALFVGFTVLLTHDGILNALFGKKGDDSAGLLKSHTDVE